MKTLRLFKKWVKMLGGKSVFHATQGEGKVYSKKEIKGYYNDLTCKVCASTLLDGDGIPYNITVSGVKAYFPITIFQYGLGLYDLYLVEKNKDYLKRFLVVANWAVKKQRKDGSWDCMGVLNNKVAKIQSSMCQGQGASLLLRAYIATKDRTYYQSAKRAIDLMLKPVDNGGTTLYIDDGVVFEEYVTDVNLAVLNGWIFSFFGLYDLLLVDDDVKYKKALEQTVLTMEKYIDKYDRGFWSDYDICGTIASPFYHDLHINLLMAMSKLTGKKCFEQMARKWARYRKSKPGRYRAMLIKLKQKLEKNELYDGDTGLAK